MPQIGSVVFDGALGFGTMSLSNNLYKGAEDITQEQFTAVIKAACAAGTRLFNTSDLYGPYTNEEMLGRAVKGLDGVVVATKWGPMFKDGQLVMDASPENCRRCIEGALKRLDRPYVDVFTMRGPPDPKVPLEVTFAEVKKLVDEGKVRAVGISECGPQDIRKANSVCKVDVVEMEYSLFSRDLEEEVIPLCQELNIAVLAYSPLGRGLLTGTITSTADLPDGDFRKFGQPRFAGDALAENLKLVDNLKAMAQAKGCTPSQLALAWILAKSRQFGITIVPIPGSKREKYLLENLGTLKLAPLTDDEVAQLEAAVDASKVAGDRYAHMAATYQGSKAGAGSH